jgi:hypothetical protein
MPWGQVLVATRELPGNCTTSMGNGVTITLLNHQDRELANLSHAILDASDKCLLDPSELLVIADISAAESFFKGASTSKKLFELMLSLKELQMHKGIILFSILLEIL